MPLAPLSFLVVDDSAGVRRIMSAILKSFGVDNVVTAGTVTEGFAALRRTRVDLAFIDLNLGDGGAGGLLLLRLIRTAADSPDPHLPVIAFSAYSEQKRVEAARDAGATEFMAKPISATEVFRRISAAVEQPRGFVRSPAYHGPDRRRRVDPDYEGPERRRAAEAATAEAPAPSPAMASAG